MATAEAASARLAGALLKRRPLAPGKHGAGGSGSGLKSTRTTLLSRAITYRSMILSMETPVFFLLSYRALRFDRIEWRRSKPRRVEHAPVAITISLSIESALRFHCVLEGHLGNYAA